VTCGSFIIVCIAKHKEKRQRQKEKEEKIKTQKMQRIVQRPNACLPFVFHTHTQRIFFFMPWFKDSLCLFLLYFFWVCAHFFSSHYYPVYCTPYNVKGFFMSPLLAPSPHCSAMRWMIASGGSNICAGWLILGAFCLDLLKIKHVAR